MSPSGNSRDLTLLELARVVLADRRPDDKTRIASEMEEYLQRSASSSWVGAHVIIRTGTVHLNPLFSMQVALTLRGTHQDRDYVLVWKFVDLLIA